MKGGHAFVGVIIVCALISGGCTAEPTEPKRRAVTTGPLRSEGFLLDRSCAMEHIRATCTALQSASRRLTEFFEPELDGVAIGPSADGTVYETRYDVTDRNAEAFFDASFDMDVNLRNELWKISEKNFATGHFLATKGGDGYPTRTVRIEMELDGRDMTIHVHMTVPAPATEAKTAE